MIWNGSHGKFFLIKPRFFSNAVQKNVVHLPVTAVSYKLAVGGFINRDALFINRGVNTGSPISNATELKIEYLHYGSSIRADFFTSDRGMLTLYIHTGKVRENLY